MAFPVGDSLFDIEQTRVVAYRWAPRSCEIAARLGLGACYHQASLGAITKVSEIVER